MPPLARLPWFRDTRTRGLARRVVPAVRELEDRTVPTLLGQQLFPSDNPWNQQITNAPVAANSAAIMNAIISTYGNGRLHPDFGQDTQSNNPLYGIPYNVVHGNTVPKVNVVIDAYPDESDVQAAPVPANAVIEGDMQNGPTVGVDNRGDSHLLVYDEDSNVVYEFYRASRPSENSDGQWHADQESVWNLNTNTFRTIGFTSADAAGLPILPGLVRPDEALPVNQGGQGVINHAIRFTLRNAVILNQFLYPASHTANPGNTKPGTEPPMGARFRLKASVDISSLNPESRVIAQAMKDYGMIVADNGSNFFFSGASYSVNASDGFALTWDDNDIQDSAHGLKSLTFSDFEVVSLAPVVTGLSVSSGPAAATVTVLGQNFSGAAGRLQVLFGGKPATSVTVVDDSHVTAVVPAGSGTVDVQVQSGVSDPGDTSDYTNPIFGYGISATSAADRFTYGSSGSNQPPTVATPASASPNPVNGNTTTLSVLGADDGGEANLAYTWADISASPLPGPTFSANGTNAAKTTTATFSRAGSYPLQVTITDAGGLSTTSTVTVTVNQTLTSITVSPPTATVDLGAQQQFSATALDQFGAPLATQPATTWSAASGQVDGTGLYTAPAGGHGTVTVRASAAGVSGSARVTLGPSGGSNQPPTVAAPAAASPNPVSGTTAALAVLGADDGGEANLTYTWSVLSAPSGAAPAFAANGSNPAKNTVVNFNEAGSYQFLVTITDTAGLRVTSSVGVTVGQTVARIVVSPVTAAVRPRRRVQFTALAFDQFGQALVGQPVFSWAVSGGGTIGGGGLYTAPKRAHGSAVIQAGAGGASGTGALTIGTRRRHRTTHHHRVLDRRAAVPDVPGDPLQPGS
jgi:hypothetical protein